MEGVEAWSEAEHRQSCKQLHSTCQQRPLHVVVESQRYAVAARQGALRCLSAVLHVNVMTLRAGKDTPCFSANNVVATQRRRGRGWLPRSGVRPGGGGERGAEGGIPWSGENVRV